MEACFWQMQVYISQFRNYISLTLFFAELREINSK